MKSKFSKILILSLVLIMLFGTVQASAYSAYDTYTYSIDGEPLLSPTAYDPNTVITSKTMGLEIPLSTQVTDVVTDEDGDVFLADKANNRIVVLNKYYSAIATISSYVDDYGKERTLSGPQGVFVREGLIYVCDTGNSRIVVFDKNNNYSYVKTITKPDSALLSDAAFQPAAIAVDQYGRIFVVSLSCYEGVIVMSSEGDFTGFIGAQAVTYSIMQIIWRRFQTREQRERQISNVSVSYNNITIDEDGFVFVTNNNLDQSKQAAAIKSKSYAYSPIKKLNSAGDEIMKRNGFFDPGGEVAIQGSAAGVSSIVDAAIGEEKSWSILDRDRSRIFTYDQNGNLLFAFGDKGNQLGNGFDFVGITYHNVDGVNYLLALDNTTTGYQITVYSPTDYCNTIMAALRNQNEHDYAESINYWEAVLTNNNNFDLAYIGIGKALYSQGDFKGSMEMLSKAYETSQYSEAFSEVRKDFLSRGWLVPIAILLIALVVGLIKFLSFAKKKNKAVSLKVGRKTYGEELLFAFHLWLHPFDGFWDLKHEQRGSVRGGLTILGVTMVAFFYQSIGRGYIFNPRGNYSTIIVQILAIGVPVLLWCVGNWCLTTLFEGEGSFKDIFVATTYSLTPLPILVIISTVLTNILTATEGSTVSLLVTFGYIWVALLLFFGTLVTHDYSISKNLLIVICTIVAMAVIMFVAILFSSLVAKIVMFVMSIISEIANRA